MKQVTVKDLLLLCQQEVKKGNGSKNIVISDDNEGNGYHGLFFTFTRCDEEFQDSIYDSESKDEKTTIILG